MGGAMGIIATQPLDTIRIRLQNPNFGYRGIAHCAQQTFATEGIRGLYKGVGSPLATVGLMNAILFYTNDKALELIATKDSASGEQQSGVITSVVAGMLSGVASVFISSPTELIKIRAQLNLKSEGTIREEVQIFKQLARSGVRDGLLRGMGLCAIRDVPSFGVYFGVYEIGCQVFGKSTLGLLVAGGLAGVLSWGSVYPVDVLKTHWQSARPGQFKTYKECYDWLVKREPARIVFARGMSATLLRAFPQCGVVFCTYESCKQLLTN